ncbi:hypothetical protein Bsp3421_006120 [Burkholderia sp. FERM BP-3421]|uniref:hypothetical protein n=1 Tax=Burkholderia sp. FERM BP-3421 TaxID=1494466 RepID=UPI002360ABBF|nr:hypothetical protein [Burkholderia sp. FERM BP-3421]WDD95937.1 hypothetical protein Bsp3421_006120 [Burkholderia sp. FERM BP-3421]
MVILESPVSAFPRGERRAGRVARVFERGEPDARGGFECAARGEFAVAGRDRGFRRQAGGAGGVEFGAQQAHVGERAACGGEGEQQRDAARQPRAHAGRAYCA